MEPSRKQLTDPQLSLFGSHTRLRDNWGQVYENKRAATHRGPIKEAFLGGGYVCPSSEFQKWLLHVLKRRPCHCRYFTIVFVIFLVAVVVLNQRPVICHQLICFKSLFQGHVACRNFTLTGPH